MAAPLQAHTRETMSPPRKRGAGFTITELMVVLVIIGILAAVATPSFTRDNTARKGREFARMVAQTLQRAHLEAMSSRSVQAVILRAGRIEVRRASTDALLWSVASPSYTEGALNTTIWAANTTATVPTSRPPSAPADATVAVVFFGPTGNASEVQGSAVPANWQIYIRNEALNPKHPDGGFLVSVTGLTSFVSMRNFEFAE